MTNKTTVSKKLVFYKDVLQSGRGADRATAALVNTLASRGYEVHVIVGQAETVPLSVTFLNEVTCHYLPPKKPGRIQKWINKLCLSSAGGAQILRNRLPRLDSRLNLSQTLQAYIRQLKPDLVISAGTNECVDLLYAGALTDIPILQMFHVYPPVCFKKNKYQRVTFLRAALAHVKACQVLLPSHRRALAQYTSVPIHVIGNAVTAPVDEPIAAPESREKTIVYIAYFSKDKNHAMLLEAFAKLKRAEGWRLKLYGSGTPAWGERLRQLVAALGIADRVQFCGLTDSPRQVLAQAGICAYPSLVEGFGLALVEAMWMGVPCVGFADAPGVNEIIDHEATGLLASDCTAEAFAEQLQTLIDNPHLREELGHLAAKNVRESYSEAHIWALWEDLIAQNCP